MSDTKKVKFHDYEVEIKQIYLKDANILFPFVASAMTKISLGDFDYFSGLKSQDMELFQRKLCENCVKVETGKNLALSDIQDNLRGFIPLLLEFLEFNFGFFSEARKILEQLLPKISETDEKEKAA